MKNGIRRRWHVRLSLRQALILMTIVCAYLASWKLTWNQGVQEVVAHVNEQARDGTGPYNAGDPLSPAPFIVSIDVRAEFLPATPQHSRAYYLWFFGSVTNLS